MNTSYNKNFRADQTECKEFKNSQYSRCDKKKRILAERERERERERESEKKINKEFNNENKKTLILQIYILYFFLRIFVDVLYTKINTK